MQSSSNTPILQRGNSVDNVEQSSSNSSNTPATSSPSSQQINADQSIFILNTAWVHIDDDTQLSLRQVSKSGLALFQEKNSVRPYKSKGAFLLSGITEFCHGKKEEFTRAYKFYKQLASYPKGLQAVIYRRSDNAAQHFIKTNLNSKVHPQLCYDPPGDHTWALNYAWILGGTDAGLDYKILSTLDYKATQRNTDTSKLSAFSSEIGVAMNSDYELGVDASNSIVLTPKQVRKVRKTHSKDLLPKNQCEAHRLFTDMNAQAKIIKDGAVKVESVVKRLQDTLFSIPDWIYICEKESELTDTIQMIVEDVKASLLDLKEILSANPNYLKIFLKLCEQSPEIKKSNFLTQTIKNLNPDDAGTIQTLLVAFTKSVDLMVDDLCEQQRASFNSLKP